MYGLFSLLWELVQVGKNIRRVPWWATLGQVLVVILALVEVLLLLGWAYGGVPGGVVAAYSAVFFGGGGILIALGMTAGKQRAREIAYDQAGLALAMDAVCNNVCAVINSERQRLGLPWLMNNRVLGENALKLLQEADRKSGFDDLNADYRRRIQSADYPGLFPDAIEPRALLYQKDWQLDTSIGQVAAIVADGVLALARENRRDHDTEELYLPNSFGVLLDESAQDIGMATTSSIPDPLPGIQLMIGVGAADYSSAVINRINRARGSAGVAPLVLDSSLREIVRNYLVMEELPEKGRLGRDLLKYNYAELGVVIGHAKHCGVNPIQIPCDADTEIILFEDIVAYLTNSLLEDYQDTLLSPDFRDIGVAVQAGRNPAEVHWAKAEFVIGYRTAGPNFPQPENSIE